MASSAGSSHRTAARRAPARTRWRAHLLTVVALLVLAACGQGSTRGTGTHVAEPPSSGSTVHGQATDGATREPSPPAPAPAPAPAPVSDTTVFGRVTDGATGAPMAGVIVEFKNLFGENVHLTTNRNGEYSVKLPADVYTALALTDDPDSTVNFEVVGGNNAVSVPPSTRVDFVSY